MYRFYHFHIRKTGGTSLNESFFSLNSSRASIVSEAIRQSENKIVDLNGKKYVGANFEELCKDEYFYGFSHYPIHKFSPNNSVFTIVILRDPIERIISHYNMILGNIKSQEKRSWLEAESKWVSKGFFEFLTKMPREKLLNQLYTFSENFNVNEAIDNILNINHVIFNDNYEAGIKDLCKKTGLNLDMYHSHKSNYTFDLKKSEKENLKEIFTMEFQVINKLKDEMNG
jgi:Sulfotransferase family